jgi:hypothetical protein
MFPDNPVPISVQLQLQPKKIIHILTSTLKSLQDIKIVLKKEQLARIHA